MVTDKSTVPPYRTNSDDNDAVFDSSTVGIYNYYYYIKNNLFNYTEFCKNVQYPLFKENLDKWIGLLFKPEYLKIIFYLIELELCHVGGLVKTLHEDVGNLSKKLQNLSKYGIIELADKEKYKNPLYKHKRAFRIDDWHFEKADWYKLTELGSLFYGHLDYSISVTPNIIASAKNWKVSLQKTIKQMKKERDQYSDVFNSYKMQKEKHPDFDKWAHDWAKDKITLGHVKLKGATPEKLLNEMKQMFQEGQ